MASARRLNEIGPTITSLAKAAAQGEAATVRKMTQVGTEIVDQSGRRFHIRAGGSGKKWPLEGKGDVKTFGTKEGAPVVRGAIRGVPEGFWKIVTDGSRPHFISTRMNRGETRTLKNGQLRRALSVKAQNRKIMGGAKLAALAPLRTPYGPRQYVRHPGHGQIGDPWSSAMMIAEARLPQVQRAETGRRMVEAFTKG